MNLGYIDYLNCYPFYFHMFEKQPLSGIRIIPGYPTDLNQGMISGELDMSPISAASCAQLDGRVLLLSQFCLSSVGYVSSVVLRSNIPIEELDGRKIAITSASHTSVVLLKILLKRYYNIEPVYVIKAPETSIDDLDAGLIIGNEALILNRQPVPYMYDLGELWLRKTGFPVVFAVFAVQDGALQKHPSLGQGCDQILPEFTRLPENGQVCRYRRSEKQVSGHNI